MNFITRLNRRIFIFQATSLNFGDLLRQCWQDANLWMYFRDDLIGVHLSMVNQCTVLPQYLQTYANYAENTEGHGVYHCSNYSDYS